MSASIARELSSGRTSDVSNHVPDIAEVKTRIAAACKRIAPLWPLKHFVAVNPFLGFTDKSFGSTCAHFRRVARIETLMPRSFYRQAIATGTIRDEDLMRARAVRPGSPIPADLDALKEWIACEPAQTFAPGAVIATVAEVLDRLAMGEKRASRTVFMVEEISKWCAAYFDQGQASWQSPSRGLPPYKAWRASMRHDRNPEVMGLRGFRAAVAGLPDDPIEAIARIVWDLGIPGSALEDYLFRPLLDIGGWAAYARYRGWDSALCGRDDDTLVQLLAIRLAWGYALYLEREDQTFRDAWEQAMQAAAALPADDRLGDDPELAIDLLLQDAYEAAYQRRLLMRLTASGRGADGRAQRIGARPPLQAAFCIDVRSEVLRRALEAVVPEAKTLGFAGFFGFPIEYVPIGHKRGGAQCPVLLKPAFVVCETVKSASEPEQQAILKRRLLRRRVIKAWKAFKLSAVSSFPYVEAAGLLFAGKLAADSMGLTRPVLDPSTDGLDRDVIARIGPRIEPREVAGRETGFTQAQRLAVAEGVLRAMSLTGDFARFVLLAGHGSTTINNPHASGLDCGACGGHTGEANARVAAAILNDSFVRAGLADKGIQIPPDTWFLGALHDTATDDIRIFEKEKVPLSHQADLAQLEDSLARASALARQERAPLLGIKKNRALDRHVLARSRDWSQVRPEWGLAGNSAFIVAPRQRTYGLDLEGRAFLHEYDWHRDEGFNVLELIMTAPMVVGVWINLQYYGSVVNNRVFGSGNKTLHNVVGQLGVFEGNAGDLRVGLPLQSVHDGDRFVHEPLRLNVFIEAPAAEIERIIEKHEDVRQLVDNHWLHLFRIADDGTISRHAGKAIWQAAA